MTDETLAGLRREALSSYGSLVRCWEATKRSGEATPASALEERWGGDLGYVMAYASFGIKECSWLMAESEGMNDQDDWLALFELRDGRFGFVWAGCDYTGWG